MSIQKYGFIFMLALTVVFFMAPKNALAKDPVEITAENTLEWDTVAKTYTARGHAVATQGHMTLNSDTLTAHYAAGASSTDITKVTAEGHVVIAAPPYRAYAQHAVYDLQTGLVTLTGDDLKMTTDTETITARDKIEFSQNENRLTAIGDATVTRPTDTLRADRISAFFQKDTNEKIILQKATAHINVTIKTARETVYGSSATYDPLAGKATLQGPVKIKQGQSEIVGSRAEIDLKSGLSKLFAEGNMETQGRVKGIFYPK